MLRFTVRPIRRKSETSQAKLHDVVRLQDRLGLAMAAGSHIGQGSRYLPLTTRPTETAAGATSGWLAVAKSVSDQHRQVARGRAPAAGGVASEPVLVAEEVSEKS